MKHYTTLHALDSINFATNPKDAFIEYGLHRINALGEAMNESAKQIFLYKNEDTVIQNLERFYIDHNDTYDGVVESFNKYTEDICTRHARCRSIIESYTKTIQSNAYLPNSYTLLNEAINIDPNEVLGYLINESYSFGRILDINSTLNKTYANEKYVTPKLHICENPNDALRMLRNLCEALQYSITKNSDKSLVNEAKKLSEGLTNIYSIYKEGTELIQTQDKAACQLFKMFLNDEVTNFDFAIHRLEHNLKDPATFMQLCIMYLDLWISNNRVRLGYKFPGDTFNRLQLLKNNFDILHPMIDSPSIPEIFDYHYTHPKMLRLLDVMLSISSMLRIDLRNLICKYISIVRPLIDSYYRDYMRSNMRTGY